MSHTTIAYQEKPVLYRRRSSRAFWLLNVGKILLIGMVWEGIILLMGGGGPFDIAGWVIRAILLIALGIVVFNCVRAMMAGGIYEVRVDSKGIQMSWPESEVIQIPLNQIVAWVEIARRSSVDDDITRPEVSLELRGGKRILIDPIRAAVSMRTLRKTLKERVPNLQNKNEIKFTGPSRGLRED